MPDVKTYSDVCGALPLMFHLKALLQCQVSDNVVPLLLARRQ